MRRFSFLPILILIFTGPAYGSDLINLIRQGKTEEARRLMDSTASAAHRDGGRIFRSGPFGAGWAEITGFARDGTEDGGGSDRR